jgi:steroid delta-isomerase-like uncharacterized protein
MTTEPNRRIMERFTREFLTTDDPAEAARLAEQWIDPDITLHFAGTEHGRETYLAVVASNRVTFPDFVWAVDQIVADGDSVAVRYTLRGTQLGDFGDIPRSGKPVVAQSMAFCRLTDGEIVEERAQLDMLSVLQQIGAIPGAEWLHPRHNLPSPARGRMALLIASSAN